MKTAIFPTISNPPTFGVILSLRYVEKLYEKIYVCVEDKPRVLNTDKIVHLLSVALGKDNLKYAVISNKADFTELTILPTKLPKFDDILTDNPRVYSNLIGKGYQNVVLIPKPLGWDETFHRVAYNRSTLYEKVMNDIRTSNNPEKYVKDYMK